MVNQRSKSGCWTCRLRRKKCQEDGMPCSNCVSRGVVCHGYGERPAWKDRGEREKEEVDRLQLRRRSHTRCPRPELPSEQSPPSQQQNTRRHSDGDCLPPSLFFTLPTAAITSRPTAPAPVAYSPLELSIDDGHICGGPSDLPIMLNMQHTDLPQLDTPSTPHQFWSGGMEGLLGSTPELFDSGAYTLNDVMASSQNGNSSHQSGHQAARGPPAASAHMSGLQELEIELMMQFLGDDFARLYPCYRSASMAERAWLLWLLQRSRLFFYAALSTSAYFRFLKASPQHGARRNALFRQYDELRNRAMELYQELLGAGRNEHRQSGDWVAKEILICSVQLAMLESLGENVDPTLAYLNSASEALTKLPGDHYDADKLRRSTTPADPPSPSPSGMERSAVEFFTCILISVHVVHYSPWQSTPGVASLYRQILSSSTLSETFFHVVGVESWIHVALIDATDVVTWKRNQDVDNRLSMRELVRRSEAILSMIEQGFERREMEDVQTLIYAHGVAIYIHTIISGCRPAVPEIQDALEKSISLWKKASFCHGELRSMSWPFCVSASLAVGEQRSVFADILNEAVAADPWSATLESLKSMSEESWRILDAGNAECDWEVVVRNLKQSVRGGFI